jgi:predicted transposase YbfD/YdcC
MKTLWSGDSSQNRNFLFQGARWSMFYISSMTADARHFSQRIRDHWQVENRLHWVKDVVFKEDSAPLCSGHAPENMAILRTMAINLLRLNGFTSMTQGIRAVAHDVHRLFSFFQ